MSEYKISYTVNGLPRFTIYVAESDGEAVETWEDTIENRYEDAEFISIIEL